MGFVYHVGYPKECSSHVAYISSINYKLASFTTEVHHIATRGLPGPLLLAWFNFNPSTENNDMPSKVCAEITYPLHRWSLGMDKYFSPHIIMDVIILIHAGIKVTPC